MPVSMSIIDIDMMSMDPLVPPDPDNENFFR